MAIFFLRKTLAFDHYKVTTLAQTSIICYSLRSFSVANSDQNHSFTVSYLINSLGFSPQSAKSASRFLKFDSSEKPDKAIELLKGYAFTHSQILSLFRRNPNILSYDFEAKILPKLDFLQSKGISGPEFAKTLSLYPTLLTRSLSNQIIPAYEFFRDFFRSDKMTNSAIIRFPDLLNGNIENYFLPNIITLRQHKVPDSKIASLLYNWPKVMWTNPIHFNKMVKEVVEMGFDPSKHGFVVAVYAMHLKRVESKWDDKANVYKKWGWSEEELLKAFRKSPWCMLISNDKITRLMGFFVTGMGLKASELANTPIVFTFSLEKRIIPRVEFYQVLMSRGLVKKRVLLTTLLNFSEKNFLRKFVIPLAEEAPDLVKLYQQKVAPKC